MKNQEISWISKALIRWVVEMFQKFVQRELKRGKTYHGISLTDDLIKE
jgi:hypothetical protein